MSKAAVFSISNYTGSFQMKLAYLAYINKFILLLDMAYIYEFLEVRL